jgi:hypothetical protein
VEPVANVAALRWVRAVVLSALIAASTLGAHVAGGGALPDLSLLLPVCALLTVSAAALLGRPLSWWWCAGTLLLGQTALHGVLQVVPGPARTVGMPGHAPAGSGDAGSTALTVLTAWSPDARMVGAHLAAALLVGAWLAAGERAAWSLARLGAGSMTSVWLRVRRVLLWLATPAGLPSAPRMPSWAPEAGPYVLDEARSAVSRRGPPSRRCARSR